VKHLPKYLQPRWRYLAVGIETWPEASIDSTAFQRALWYSAQNLLGDAGSADVDLSVVQFHHGGASGEAMVRVRRGETERARAVVACIDEVDTAPVGVRVRGGSGTIQACEEKYMGRGREEPDQRHVVFDGTERSGSVRDGRVDVRTESTYTGATTLDCN
jgi:ribonuclease P/MRP protein subunit POP5